MCFTMHMYQLVRALDVSCVASTLMSCQPCLLLMCDARTCILPPCGSTQCSARPRIPSAWLYMPCLQADDNVVGARMRGYRDDRC